MYNLPESAQLYASDRHGIYIPQYFAESVQRHLVTGIPEIDWDILTGGPEEEHYWDAWDDALNNARLTDSNGVTWVLYQDGDLWIVPSDWEPEEEE